MYQASALDDAACASMDVQESQSNWLKMRKTLGKPGFCSTGFKKLTERTGTELLGVFPMFSEVRTALFCRELEQTISKLPPAELLKFREWFLRFDGDRWDEQIEKDATFTMQHLVRVGIAYHALGVEDGGTIVWFWIGNHDEYEQLING